MLPAAEPPPARSAWAWAAVALGVAAVVAALVLVRRARYEPAPVLAPAPAPQVITLAPPAPQPAKAAPETQRVSVVLDSRDRDYGRHPSASAFTIQLPRTYFNVSRARLKSAELPSTYYVFTAARRNTTLRVTVGGDTRDVALADGNYTFATMSSALAAALGAAFPGRAFSVRFDKPTYRCTIRASPPATIAVDTTMVDPAATPTQWGLGYFLGFAPAAVTAGSGSVTGATVATMNPETYVLLDIAQLNGMEQPAMYGGGGTAGRAFAKVPITDDSFQYNIFYWDLTANDYASPIAKLSKLDIAVRFHDGTLVDFNGAEYSLTLEIECTRTR